jgi:hypothetical protein
MATLAKSPAAEPLTREEYATRFRTCLACQHWGGGAYTASCMIGTPDWLGGQWVRWDNSCDRWTAPDMELEKVKLVEARPVDVTDAEAFPNIAEAIEHARGMP